MTNLNSVLVFFAQCSSVYTVHEKTIFIQGFLKVSFNYYLILLMSVFVYQCALSVMFTVIMY